MTTHEHSGTWVDRLLAGDYRAADIAAAPVAPD
jgi:hypothetical protein